MATKSQLKNLLWTNFAFFVIVAVAHLLRLLYRARIIVNDFEIPLWLSIVAVIVLGTLAYYNYLHARK